MVDSKKRLEQNLHHLGPPPPGDEGVAGKFIFLLILIGIGILVIWVARSCTGPSEPDVPDAFDAWWKCRTVVESGLKAPSTADFKTFREAQDSRRLTNQPAKKVYSVDVSVDAQNSFGAMIRADYTCQVTFQPMSDGEWGVRLDSISER